MIRPVQLALLGILLLGPASLGMRAVELEVDGFQLTLGKSFAVLTPPEAGLARIRTPAWHPVSVLSLPRGSHQNWEAAALDFLVATYRQSGFPKDPTLVPEEISIKREGAWTTLYWTFGGTEAFFGMYFGGRSHEEGALIFWADPARAPGRSQYQALSEVTKGITVLRLGADRDP